MEPALVGGMKNLNERILMSSPQVGGDNHSNLKITREVLKTPVNSYSKKLPPGLAGLQEVTRKDYIQAVVSYFDVGFTH